MKINYEDTLEQAEKVDSIVELLRVWENRDKTLIPGNDRWPHHQLELCIKELRGLHERKLYD